MNLKEAYNKIDNFCCSNHNILQGNKIRYLNDREETIDMFQDYRETKDDDFCKDENEMVEALDTIKKVVDLQEQIHCPLVVVFKAVLRWIYYEDASGNITRDYVDLHTTLDGEYVLICNNNKEVFFIKDYKKTWWLKKDKSE